MPPDLILWVSVKGIGFLGAGCSNLWHSPLPIFANSKSRMPSNTSDNPTLWMRGQCHSRFDQRIQRKFCTSETKTDGKHNRKMPNVALWKLSCYKSNLSRSWNRKENFQAIRIGGLWNQRACKNSKAHVEASLLWLFVEHGNRLCQTCLFAAGPPPSCTERTAYFLPRGLPSSKNVSSFHMILLMEGILHQLM